MSKAEIKKYLAEQGRKGGLKSRRKLTKAKAKAMAAKRWKKPQLTEFQKRKLEMLNKGYGLSAAKHNWKAQELREMYDLVARGLARMQAPAPWNRAGAFSKID